MSSEKLATRSNSDNDTADGGEISHMARSQGKAAPQAMNALNVGALH